MFISFQRILKKYFEKPSFRVGAIYTGSSLFKSLINILAGFLVLHYVGPEEIGLWQAFFIASTYAAFLNFGVPTGLHREIPFLMGRGEIEKAMMLTSSARFLSFACAGITLLILSGGVVYFILHKSPINTLLSFTGVFLVIGISFLHNYYVVLYRTNQAFKNLSKINFIEGVFLLLLFPAIVLWGFHGYIAYQVLNHLFFLSLLVLFNPIKTSLRFNIRDIFHLAKIGLPIFILGYLYSIGKSFLKFAILAFGGVHLLGIFAPVFAVINAVKMLPLAISRFLYPKFSYQLGKTGDPQLLWKPVRKITILLIVSHTIFFVPVVFIIPNAIESFFPKYTDSILSTQMVILSAILSSSFIGINALNSLKAIKSRLYITIIYLVSSIIFPFTMPSILGNPILGIAISIIIIDVFNFITSWFITKKALLNAKIIE